MEMTEGYLQKKIIRNAPELHLNMFDKMGDVAIP